MTAAPKRASRMAAQTCIGAAVPLFRFAFMFTDIPDEQAAYLLP